MAYCTQHGPLLQVASSVKIPLGFLQMICDPGQAPVYFISQKQASWSIKLSVCMCVCVLYTPSVAILTCAPEGKSELEGSQRTGVNSLKLLLKGL